MASEELEHSHYVFDHDHGYGTGLPKNKAFVIDPKLLCRSSGFEFEHFNDEGLPREGGVAGGYGVYRGEDGGGVYLVEDGGGVYLVEDGGGGYRGEDGGGGYRGEDVGGGYRHRGGGGYCRRGGGGYGDSGGQTYIESSFVDKLSFGEGQEIKRESWVLTGEGQKYAGTGSPEVQLLLAVPEEGSISKEDLMKKLDPAVFKIGCSQAGKNKWVVMGKTISRKVQRVEDIVKDFLTKIRDGQEVGKDDINALKARKLIVAQIWKGYSVKKGPNYAPKRKKAATDLTREHIQRGEWKDLEFKEYNFNAKGMPPDLGCLHPLLKVRDQVKYIFLDMGFEEMPTNNFVESSFWNFDTLFQPQQHPARDSHDTFFLRVPSTTRDLPEDYVKRVKQVHKSGGYGSRGYNYDWKRDEANKNLLRTHTTAVSSRMLNSLAQKPFTPKKYFSIDRVFRNEAVDRTHLAEFHQIEGLICDRGLTLGDLIGVLHDFFARLGMSKLRFKPAYNPYTEPSMEIFSYHEGLGKWVEVGNSGMFRPEMLLPMGLPEDVRVIAWGLSLERPTMILYGIDNIRDLFGHKVDLGLIKRNPLCLLGL